jgi:hypothetical protein
MTAIRLPEAIPWWFPEDMWKLILIAQWKKSSLVENGGDSPSNLGGGYLEWLQHRF